MTLTKLREKLLGLCGILRSCRIGNLIKKVGYLRKSRNHDNRLLVKLAADDENRSCDGLEICYRSATKLHYDHKLHYYFSKIISYIFT